MELTALLRFGEVAPVTIGKVTGGVPEPWWAFRFMTSALLVLDKQYGILQLGETEPPHCISGRPGDVS